MTLETRLRQALDAMPPGSLVPVSWIRGLLDECGEGDEVDLTVQDVAPKLDRAPSTIRTRCGAGRLPAEWSGMADPEGGAPCAERRRHGAAGRQTGERSGGPQRVEGS